MGSSMDGDTARRRGMYGVLAVILIALLVCIWAMLRSGEQGEELALKTEDLYHATQEDPGVSFSIAPVITDEVAPEIRNAVDRVFWVGDSIVYTGKYTRETDEGKVGYLKVTAADNSGAADLEVDRDAVIADRAGTYPVTYTATDAAGNETSVTVRFTLLEKPEGYVDPEEVYQMARQILDDITTGDMTDMEVAFAIYRWTKSNISYVGSSDKSSWTAAAYQAFTKRSGDCYNYFAAAKALYTVAGIENVDVVRSDTTYSAHYWSLIDLGEGWYHVDCTPRRVEGDFFMNTDAELEAYSLENGNSHIFDGDLYPERATKSVQHLVDYASGEIKVVLGCA